MTSLDARRVVYLVVHTAESAGEVSVAEIRRWHVEERGWSDIGYHFVIHMNGEVEVGRSLEYIGAHCLGINSQSIGVCCTGNGDREPFTPKQEAALTKLAVSLHHTYGIRPHGMIGHREINRLIENGLVPGKYHTTKTCPGRRVHMPRLRKLFVDALTPPPEPLEIEAAAA